MNTLTFFRSSAMCCRRVKPPFCAAEASARARCLHGPFRPPLVCAAPCVCVPLIDETIQRTMKQDKVVKWTNEGTAPTYLGLSSPLPGKVIPVDLRQAGAILTKPQMFLCRYSIALNYGAEYYMPSTAWCSLMCQRSTDLEAMLRVLVVFTVL